MALERVIAVYKVTNPKGQVYIGSSVNALLRMQTYKNPNTTKNKQLKLHESLVKFGHASHKFEIVEVCDKTELLNKERHYQELYECMSDKGLNNCYVNCEGKKRVVSGSGRKMMSDYAITRREWFIENVCKLSPRHKGGKLPEEWKYKVMENSGMAKVVLNTETGIYYPSCRQAAESANIKHSTLKNRLNGCRGVKNNTKFIYV